MTHKMFYLLGFIAGAIVGGVVVQLGTLLRLKQAGRRGARATVQLADLIDPLTAARMDDHNVHVE